MPVSAPLPFSRLLLPLVTTACVALTGCASLVSTAPDGASTAISGTVHGGQQPVAGSAITVVAPGLLGYGSAGTVETATTTDSNGNFTLTRPYPCPPNNGLVYILAKGGNAGAGNNPALSLAAVLGPCSALTAATNIDISEATTVAAAYALAPFASIVPGGVNIGTSATNTQGLNNAAGAAFNLANLQTGGAHTSSDFPGIVVPTAEINTLADILASCVNQGTTPTNTGSCPALFAATTNGGVPPTDTFQAAVGIAQHPGAAVATLFGLSTPSAPFQPTLGTAPPDFSLALGFNGGAISASSGTVSVAIDAAGNAWFTTGLNGNVHVLTEISPAGQYVSGSAVARTTGYGSSNLNNPIAVAIDQLGFVYVTNNGGGNVQKFNSNGSLNSTITAASFLGTNAIAIDAAGDAWVGNFSGNNITEISLLGVEAAGSPFFVGGGQDDVAISPTAIWASSYSQNGSITRIDNVTHASTQHSTGGSNGGVAIDASNSVWIATTGNGSVMHIADNGNFLSPFGGYQADPSTNPQNIIVDGLGNVFAGSANYATAFLAGSLLEYSNAGTLLSPAVGFSGSGVVPVVPSVNGGIGIDGSGNVWIAGGNNGTTFPNYATEVIGIAAPVITPKAVAVTSNKVGTRP